MTRRLAMSRREGEKENKTMGGERGVLMFRQHGKKMIIFNFLFQFIRRCHLVAYLDQRHRGEIIAEASKSSIS